MTEAQIGVMRGDLSGPEVMGATLPVLDEIARQAGAKFKYAFIPVSGEAYDQTGTHLPDSSLEAARLTDAVLKAPFGGPPNSQDPKWQNLEVNTILPLRQELGVYANLRPVDSGLSRRCVQLSPLRPRLIKDVDLMFVRDLSGDVYFGKRESGINSAQEAYANETGEYTESQVRRLVKTGLKVAMERNQQLTLVHKTNVLTETGKLWTDIFDGVTGAEPGVSTNYMHVDAMAAALVSNPKDFGTIVLPNMFGDILTDEAGALIGSIGLGGSASLGEGDFGLYEPIHGSSPDIAGQGKVNPAGMMLAAAMLLRHSLHMPEEATAVEQAVGKTLDKGYLTADLHAKYLETSRLGQIADYVRGHRAFEVSTMQFSRQVVKEIRHAA